MRPGREEAYELQRLALLPTRGRAGWQRCDSGDVEMLKKAQKSHHSTGGRRQRRSRRLAGSCGLGCLGVPPARGRKELLEGVRPHPGPASTSKVDLGRRRRGRH